MLHDFLMKAFDDDDDDDLEARVGLMSCEVSMRNIAKTVVAKCSIFDDDDDDCVCVWELINWMEFFLGI